MMKLARTPARKAKTLPQQQTDFTSEGAPPPGRVATDVPRAPDTTARRAVRKPHA